jgi:hypothetical protein
MLDDEEYADEASLDQSSAEVTCPHCGEVIEIILDPGGGDEQEYVEDCEVCCRPWQVFVTWDSEGNPEVRVETA